MDLIHLNWNSTRLNLILNRSPLRFFKVIRSSVAKVLHILFVQPTDFLNLNYSPLRFFIVIRSSIAQVLHIVFDQLTNFLNWGSIHSYLILNHSPLKLFKVISSFIAQVLHIIFVQPTNFIVRLYQNKLCYPDNPQVVNNLCQD